MNFFIGHCYNIINRLLQLNGADKSILLLPFDNFKKGLGSDCRDTGHKREPEPPDIITGIMLMLLQSD